MMSNATKTKDRRKLIQAAYQEYLKAKHELFAISELCAFKGWPDRKDALKIAFRIQFLFNEVEALRLEYVLQRNFSEIIVRTSVAGIFKRLINEWSEDEEAALKEDNPTYTDVVSEIARLNAKKDSAAVDGPLQAMEKDPEYIRAREMMRRVLREVNKKLAL